MNPSEPGAFCFGRLLIIDSISITYIGLFRWPSFFYVSFGKLCLSTDLFHLGYQICGQKVMHSTLKLSFWFPWIGNDVTYFIFDMNNSCPLSYIFIIYIAWLEAYQFYWFFSKNQLLAPLIFSNDFLYSASLISLLILIVLCFHLLLF